MYSDMGNASQMFEIRSKLKEMKQGSKSVTQHFSDLQELWQELDLLLKKTMTASHVVLNCRNILRKKGSLIFLRVSIAIWMRCVLAWWPKILSHRRKLPLQKLDERKYVESNAS